MIQVALMSTLVTSTVQSSTVQDGIAVITIDNPPVNALSQEVADGIDAAVARARQCNIANIVVVGHSDTSGSPQYNMALSERRAGVVREALVARGIPDSAITAQARGETELAQQTRDGVREPLNRRTAVTISFR